MKPSRLIYALAAAAIFVLPSAAFAQSYDNSGQNWQQHDQPQRGGRSARGQNTFGNDRGNRDPDNRWNRGGRDDDDRTYVPPAREGYDRGYDNNGGYYGPRHDSNGQFRLEIVL